VREEALRFRWRRFPRQRTLHGCFCIALQSRPDESSQQDDIVAVHPEGEVIEDAVLRQHQQFVVYLAREVSLVRIAAHEGVAMVLIMLGRKA
jgi:hypothetical protein